MILKLYKNKVIIKGNESPEEISNCKIKYEFELGTNHLVPRLIINNKVFVGDNIRISLEHLTNRAQITVLLSDANQVIFRTYKGEFKVYKTFTIGDAAHIDVYKDLVKAYERIEQLEEQGEVI